MTTGSKNGTSRRKVIAPNRLQKLRERHKADGGFYLTLAEMARLRGVDESLVSRHENGLRGMSPEDVKEYARILKVDPLDIFPHLTHSD